MVYNVVTIPIVVLFVVNGFGQLYYAFKLKKKFPNEHNFQNSILTFFLWITAGVLYPFFYLRDNLHIRWFQTLSLTIICIYTPIFILSILLFQYFFIIRRNPTAKKNRNIERFLSDFDEFNPRDNPNKSSSLITDIHRKSFHFLPAAIIISLWIFAVYIW
ncbi:MAG: hypothetical protein ACFFAO_16210, partial [Candidatus Hermodarchaeota archaeon]